MSHLLIAAVIAGVGTALSGFFSRRLYAYSAGRKSGLEWLEGRLLLAIVISLGFAALGSLAICVILDLPLTRAPIVMGAIVTATALFIVAFKAWERLDRR
jgi:putative flippase GtrA